MTYTGHLRRPPLLSKNKRISEIFQVLLAWGTSGAVHKLRPITVLAATARICRGNVGMVDCWKWADEVRVTRSVDHAKVVVASKGRHGGGGWWDDIVSNDLWKWVVEWWGWDWEKSSRGWYMFVYSPNTKSREWSDRGRNSPNTRWSDRGRNSTQTKTPRYCRVR